MAQPNGHVRSEARSDSADRGRKRAKKEPVDWEKFYSKGPPEEIIVIHDDDSPVPVPAPQSTRPPPATNGSGSIHHVDKRRRIDDGRDAAVHSNTNTPYINSASTDSLQATTAATSLTSQASTTGRLGESQTGQKRKRTTRASDAERKKQEVEKSGPRGYLAEYGEYIPPKQQKKARDVVVNVIHDVSLRKPTALKVHTHNSLQRPKHGEKVDDEDGHYIVHEGSRLGDRYDLVSLLGQGTFGKVVKAKDTRHRKEVAVKIIRAVPKYRDASRIELRVLQTLRQADEHNRNRCIQLRDCFDWRGHICIVTPLLGLSVFDFLKSGGFVPFPGSHIQAFARQLLGSIACKSRYFARRMLENHS